MEMHFKSKHWIKKLEFFKICKNADIFGVCVNDENVSGAGILDTVVWYCSVAGGKGGGGVWNY